MDRIRLRGELHFMMKRITTLAVLFVSAAFSQVTPTTIVGPVLDQFGNRYSGSFTVQGQVKTNFGVSVLGSGTGNVRTVFVNAGVIQPFTLVPNDNSVPNLSSYLVTFANQDKFICIVPTVAAPVATTATTVLNSTSISVASASGLVVGQLATGAGIRTSTTITVISGTTVTLSAAATASASGVSVTFYTTMPFTQACSPNATPPNQSQPIAPSQILPYQQAGYYIGTTAAGTVQWLRGTNALTTLTGDTVGSGTGSITTTTGRLNGISLANLATGILKNTTGTGAPSIASAGTDYLAPAGNGSGLTSLTPANISAGIAAISVTGTAAALASSPTNCSAGSGATGINASGTAQGCTAYDVSGAAAAAQAAAILASLQRASNLSDLASASSARTNLGLAPVAASGSASDLSAGTLPAGREPAHTGDATNAAGSLAMTVAAVGGSSAAAVHSGELEANAATSANTASAGVRRDANGNFFAGSIRGQEVYSGYIAKNSTIAVYPPNFVVMDKDNPDAPLQFEQSFCSTDPLTCDIPNDGTRIDAWYRPSSGGSGLYYASCTPGLNGASPECKGTDWVIGNGGNPLTLPAEATNTFNYVFKISGVKYAGVACSSGGGYCLMSNPSGDNIMWIMANGAAPILRPNASPSSWYNAVFNVGIAVKGTTCMAAIEGEHGSGAPFAVGYSYADCTGGNINFNTNITASPIFAIGGNASLRYDATFDNIWVNYGGAVDGSQLSFSACNVTSGASNCSTASNWTQPTVNIQELTGKELADPAWIFNLGSPAFPWNGLLGFSYNQHTSYQATTQLTEDMVVSWIVNGKGNLYGNQTISGGNLIIDGSTQLICLRPSVCTSAQPSVGAAGASFDGLSLNSFSPMSLKFNGTERVAIDASGNFTKGIWQGTLISPSYGGTGEAGTFTGIRKANSASADTAAVQGDIPTPATQIPYGGVSNLLTSESPFTYSTASGHHGPSIDCFGNAGYGVWLRAGFGTAQPSLSCFDPAAGTTYDGVRLNGYSAASVFLNNTEEIRIVHDASRANFAACYKSDGKTLGRCTSAVGTDGTCTCT